MMARRFEPKEISLKRWGKLGPYGNPASFGLLLDALAEGGFLKAKGDGKYTLTDKGNTTLDEALDGFYTFLGEIPVLSPEQLSQIEGLLDRVCTSCRKAQEPAKKRFISLVHRGHPEAEYAPLAKIDQHLDELNAFRDDAHIAAWKPYGVSGPTWETLTFVWRGEASSAEELLEKLPYRNHSLEVYQDSLKDLVNRGWVEKTAEGYRVTEKGRALRQEAEETTDRYYFTPWACLSTPERTQLYTLLTRLRDGLRELAKEPE
jgi:hypothetical protein